MVDGGCPILRPDTPCPDQPLAAKVTVSKDSDRSVVATIETAADGSYRIPLTPGSYTLHAANLTDAELPRGTNQRITVHSGRFEDVTLMFDSGIRGTQTTG
jgi:hypothetical protein